MKLRAFAAAWTLFTMLAAPALLLAAPDPGVPPGQAGDPAAGAPVEEAPAVEPAPEPAPPAAPEPQPVKPAPAAPAPQPVEPAAVPAEAPAAEPAPAADTERAGKRKPAARTAASASVTIADFSFSPAAVTVNVGDTVTWTNSDSVEHSATGSGFDTGLLSQGQSGSHTFTSAGSFSYICTPHPYMKGTVTVQAAASGGDDGGSDGGSDDSGSGAAGTGTDEGGTAAAGDDDGPSLPASGAESWALALLGTGFLSLGFAVRRRTESI